MQRLLQKIRSGIRSGCEVQCKTRSGWEFQLKIRSGWTVQGSSEPLRYLIKMPNIACLIPLGHMLEGVELNLINANFLSKYATRFSWREGSRYEMYAVDKTGKPIAKARGSGIVSCLFFRETAVKFIRRLDNHPKKDEIAHIVVAKLGYRPWNYVYLWVGKFPQGVSMRDHVDCVLEASRRETAKAINAAALEAESVLA